MKKKKIISLFAVAGAALALASCGNDKQISVTYYDGESKVTQKVDKNTLLETPTKDGYVFAGWYTDSDYTKKYEEVMLTDSISLYAKWTLAEVTPSEEKKNETPETPQNNENNQTTPETPQNTENNQTTPETPQNNENNQTTPETPQNNENNQTTPAAPQNNENNQTTPETPQNNENTTPETPNNETQEESLADYKDGLQTQLQAFAQERIDAYSALSPSITTLRDNGNTAIDGALDKASADAALTAAKNAIISAVNEYNKANSTINVTKALGATESLYLEWDIVTGADSYNVYYKTASSNYQRINDMLIRQYTDYMRADIVGLATGSYTVKIVPVFGEEECSNSIEQTISVTSTYDRSGFAWVNGTSSGAYNEDGTLKNNAVVLYVTNNNMDKITLDVVKDSKNQKETCTGLVNILALYKKGYDSRPLDIRIIGNITDDNKLVDSDKDSKGDLVITGSSSSKRINCGITIEGIGEDATANGWGIRIKSATNVEVRNLGIMNVDSDEGDNVGLQQDNDHIWVHNCDFFYGDAGSDADQAKGDGALDCKKSTYVTFSYNHFWDNGKSNLLGLSEGTTEGLYITYHHNWYDHSDSRHPRVRFYSAHVYNNYYDGCAKYGIGATNGSSVFAESNYFRNVQYPIMTSMQGSDVFAGGTTRDVTNNATFSKESGGTIKAFGNIMTGTYTFIPYGAENYVLKGNTAAYNLTGTTSTADFDAVVVTDRNEVIADTITTYYQKDTSHSRIYNNFDTASTMYTYTADAAEDVPTVVTAKAGRLNGGDFQWTFNNAVDDASYAVNTELKAALKAYKGGIVTIQGDYKSNNTTPEQNNNNTTPEQNNNNTTPENNNNNTPEQNNNNTTPENNTPQVTGAVVHNFTADGKTSSVFTITGNLSDSKGTVTYNGLTLTQCLKIESSTNIAFTTSNASTLTLVFNDGFNGKIIIDGTAQTASNGIVTVNLAAGSHTIIKGDTANLYYITLA